MKYGEIGSGYEVPDFYNELDARHPTTPMAKRMLYDFHRGAKYTEHDAKADVKKVSKLPIVGIEVDSLGRVIEDGKVTYSPEEEFRGDHDGGL